MASLTFITSNKNKLSEVQAILGNDVPVSLQNQSVDIVEIQGTIEEVAIDKCRRAAEVVCKNPRILNFQVSRNFPYLHGFHSCKSPTFCSDVLCVIQAS